MRSRVNFRPQGSQMSVRQPVPMFRPGNFGIAPRGGVNAPWCNLCKTNHVGSCARSNVRCFKCNELGHYASECTKGLFGEPSVQGSSAPRSGRVGRPPVAARTVGARSEVSRAPQAPERPTGQTSAAGNVQQARVYVVTEKEAENAPDVIKGMASICNKSACVLIDLGATFSFISSTFVLHNKLELFDRGESILVSIPMRVSIICDKITKGVIVKIREDELE